MMNIKKHFKSLLIITGSFLLLYGQDSSYTKRDTIPELDTMKVPGERTEYEVMKTSKDIGTLELDPEDVKGLPALGEVDIARSLQLMPGISASNESSSELIIHGGEPGQNLIILDGIPLYYVDHFFGFYSPFNPEAIEHVKVFKSGFPTWYGSRISSVQSYRGKSADYEKFGIGGSLGLLSSNAHVEIPIAKKASLFLAARRAYSDILKSPVFEKIFGQFDEEAKIKQTFNTFEIYREPTFHYYDINAKANVKIRDSDTLSASFYYGKDFLETIATGFEDSTYYDSIIGNDVYRIIDGELDNDCYWGNIGGSLTWDRQWNDIYFTTLQSGYTNYFQNQKECLSAYFIVDTNDNIIDHRYFEMPRSTDNNVSEIFASLSNELKLAEWNRIYAGCKVKQIAAKYDQGESITGLNILTNETDFTDSAVLSDIDNKEEEISGWIQDNISFNKLSVDLGTRLTYYTGTHDYYISPRLFYTFYPIDVLAIKGSWGLYHQFLSRAEAYDMYLEGERYFWMLAGGYGCPVSKSNQVSTGVSFQPEGFLFAVEGYYRKMSDLVIYKRSLGANISSFMRGKGTARGIDFLLQKKAGLYTGWLCYSLSEAVYKFSEEINKGKSFYSPFDHTHEVKFVNNFNYEKFNVSLAWIYATGSPYSKPVGIYELSLMDPFDSPWSLQKYTVWGAKNSQRLPSYHRLDLSGTYKFSIREKIDMLLGISVFNLYDRNNIKERDYRFMMDDKMQKVDAVIYGIDTKCMGITPSIFLQVNFKQK